MQTSPRKLTPEELAKLTRADLITLVGPSMLNAAQRTDEDLRAFVAGLMLFVQGEPVAVHTADPLQDEAYHFLADRRGLWSRKPEGWNRVLTTATPDVARFAQRLPVFNYSLTSRPLGDVDASRPDFHVAKVGDRFFLINMEGYTYCRYVAHLPEGWSPEGR